MLSTLNVAGIIKNGTLVGVRVTIFTSNVSDSVRMSIVSKLTYSQDDFSIMQSCNQALIKFIDYYDKDIAIALNKWGISNIALMPIDAFPSVSRVKCTRENIPSLLDYIKLYNPNFVFRRTPVPSVTSALMFVDTAPKSIKYFHVNGVPVCSWRPRVHKIRSYQDMKFVLMNGILVYRNFEEIYILPTTQSRHKLVTIGDDLSINIENGYCMKTCRYIEDDVYYERVYCFKPMQRQWCIVKEEEPVAIYGYKSK